MSGSIKAIDTDSVHRIHSGQVVLDLQGAIKELVENSLDAGATSIDVRIKDNGLDTVEISDNGSGIAEADWEFIGLKHHTSKLPSLSDLHKVTTFGFRGEALSALCALCESVTIVTSVKETAPMGTIIKLGRDGRVSDSSSKVARPRGTTITLSGLFVPLPVRRKEFERTVKRELTKALTLLTAYALVPASVSLTDGRQGVRLRVEAIGAGRTGKRSTQLSTNGRGSLRASVGAVWGHKAFEGVQDINLDLTVEIDRAMARREGIEEGSQTVKVSGLISSAQWGQGRASADRQFYYINGRPCNLPSVARAINEVYKTFNTNQVPLAILDFQIPPESVDINVSPDKRTIFVHSEDRLIDALRTALDEFFQPSRSTFSVGGAAQTVKTIRQIQSQLPDYSEKDEGQETPEDDEQEEDELDEETEEAAATQEDEEKDANDTAPIGPPIGQAQDVIEIEIESEDDQPQPLLSSRTSSRPSRPPSQPSQTSQPSRRSRPTSPPSDSSSARRVIQQTISTKTAAWSPEKKSRPSSTSAARAGPGPSSREARASLREKLAGYASQSGSAVRHDEIGDEGVDEDEVAVIQNFRGEEELLHHEEDGEAEKGAEDDKEAMVIQDEKMIDDPLLNGEKGGALDEAREVSQTARKRLAEEPIFIDEEDTSPMEGEVSTDQEDEDGPMPRDRGHQTERQSTQSQRKMSTYRDEISSTAVRGEVTLKFDMTRLRARYNHRRQARSAFQSDPSSRDANGIVRDAFSAVKEAGLTDAAGISNKDAALAEEALSRVISKNDFARMEVLGQFNRGFIIVRLRSDHDASKGERGKAGNDDLFIVDQHASDEKYNFETLQRTTVIKGQALIRPRPLQLTAGDEIVAMENLDILHRNGFDVKVEEDALPGRGERISLLAMPVSKDTTFDFKDLEQLLHMLSDGARPQGQMVRCTKARSMFAMRACRKSVMIGKALTKGQMVTLLRNMGTIDQPWNCPHGRPTMRHLTKIDSSPGSTSTRARNGRGRIDWVKWKAQQERG